jgi:hypothetical protein
VKYSYATDYQPAFPMVQVVLENIEEERQTEPTPALLDTGADSTLVPIAHLRRILAPVLTSTRIRSHWGEWRPVQNNIGYLSRPGSTWTRRAVPFNEQPSAKCSTVLERPVVIEI